jgi:diguanylate cyclase (GGDEF)-like protein/PAS domain S-box-containing protein
MSLLMDTLDHDLDGAAPGTPTLGGVDSRANFWTRVLIFRSVMAFLFTIALAALPQFGPDRIWYAMVIAASSAIQNTALHRVVRRTGSLPPAIAWSDYLFGAVIAVLVPELYPWALIVITSTTALTVIGFRRRQAYILLAVWSGPYLAIGLWHRPDNWIPAYAIFVLCSLGTIYIIGLVSEEERYLRDRYSTLLEQLDMIVWESTGATRDRMTYVNESVGRLFDYQPDRWKASGFWESIIHPEDRDVIDRSRQELAAGRNHELEYRIRTASGVDRWVLEMIRVVVDAEGRTTGAQGVVLDISVRKAAEEQLQQFGSFVAEIPLELSILQLENEDADTLQYLAANRQALETLGVTLEQLLLWTPAAEEMNESRWAMFLALAEVARTGQGFEHAKYERFGPDGTKRHFRVDATPLPNHAVGVSAMDITDQMVASETLRFQAMHDSLTGLPNRALLNDRLAEALSTAEATGGAIALMFMDLNQFKEVNDALGHHHGDRLLIELGRRLSEVIRSGDTAARLGGDEFAVLMPLDVTPDQAIEMAEQIALRFGEPVEIDGVTLQTNVSIGIAVSPHHGSDAEILTQRADVAMYRAKSTGVGVSVYSPEQDHSSVRRLTLLSELDHAVRDNQLVTYYQPRIDLATGDVVDVEALVRWEHPVHGLLQPIDFIELAEISGVIKPLTIWVLDRAVRDIANLATEGHKIGVAVNLSVRNLYDPSLVDSIVASLTRSELDPTRLRVELTESELMDDPTLAMAVLSQIRATGIEISIDDFGTGYSSLSYLRDLPASEIKIDKGFVGDIAHGDSTLVRSIIELGHNLGLRVVAEGVETGPVMRELAEMGCDTAQGYFISMPLPYSELVTFLNRGGDHYRGWSRAGVTGPDPQREDFATPSAKWEPVVTDR